MAEKEKTGEIEVSTLSDIELIELLHIAGDCVTQEAVNEIIERRERMIAPLTRIVSDKNSWLEPMPEWWAVVHATYILGAFESAEALSGLLCSLRWADAFDNEWVTEDLPAIFGKIGRPAYAHLLAIVQDYPAGWGARSIALSSMAAIGLHDTALRPLIMESIAKIVENEGEDLRLRQNAANILLDFKSKKHRAILKRFGREESSRKKDIPGYEGVFYDWEVDEFLNSDSSDLDLYDRDWMIFYEDEERHRRHDYWEEEQEQRRREKEEEKGGLLLSEKRYQHCPCGSGLRYEECCKKKVH